MQLPAGRSTKEAAPTIGEAAAAGSRSPEAIRLDPERSDPLNRRTLSFAIALALLFLASSTPSPAPAETHAYAIDPVHSEVGFRIRHLVARTTGRFDEFQGTAWVDPSDVAGTLRIEGEVATASVNTHNEKRDKHLKSADFFDVENHGEMVFASREVRADGGDYEVTADLTIRGVTKSVVFNAEIVGFMTNPFTGTPSTGIDLTGKIDRKDFGMSWNKALDAGGVVLGDEVRITIHLEATVPPQES